MKNRNVLLTVAVFLGLISGLTAQNIPSYVPTNGLVGWWPFNGNANDESGNGNNGTVNGATLTADRFGSAGKAYSFDGVSNRIESTSNLTNFQEVSISVWVKQFTLAGGPFVHIGHDDGGNTFCNGMSLGVGGNSFWENGGVLLGHYSCVGYFNSNSSIATNEWTHCVLNKNGNILSFFVNGSFISEVVSNDIITPTNTIFFGSTSSGFSRLFQGSLDEIAIYNRTLTQQEITALYQGSNTTANCLDLPSNLQQGLVGYWPFCGNALDESGNGNHGTVNGATLTTDRFGNAGSAYDFDGVDDYIGCGNWNIGPSSFTLSAWVKESEVGSSPSYFISKFDGESLPFPDNNILRSWMLYRHSASNGSKYVFEMSQDGQVAQDLFFNQFGELNIWKHLSVTFNNGQVKSYVNGSLDSVFNSNFTSVFQSSVPVYFGISAKDNAPEPNSQNWMQGTLDDIAIWNRALTPQEITQLYNQGICKTSITVTDTLLIHTGITSYNPVAYQNTLKVWPNPGNQDISIDAGNLASMQGWKIRVSNAQGVQIYPSGSQSGLINQQQQTLDMSGWGGNGLYFLYLIDPQNNIQEVKKIVLAP